MLERRLACLGRSGFHSIAYREWPGPSRAPTLICVHGLSRNSRDFDSFAEAMSKTHRVVCPDMAGRGCSEWLKNSDDYDFPTYLADCAAVIARLDVETVDWIGTSMGALIGIQLAAQPGTPVRKLVVNDAGPFVSKATLAWLGSFIGADPTFDSLEAMEQAVRRDSAGFGALTDDQWRAMTLYLSRQKPGGGYGYAYDPRIGEPYKHDLPDADFWPDWDRIACRTLILRGERSIVLPRDVAEAMTWRGPRPRIVEFAGIGHPPALLSEDQIGVVRDFLIG
jgi:pimeloyl-ACP methyl ester carboxylesterase